MVLILEFLLISAIFALAAAIFVHKGNFVFTVKVEQVTTSAQRVEAEIGDLQKHFTEEMSKEEEAYYKESIGVMQTLNEILSGKIPGENEEGNT